MSALSNYYNIEAMQKMGLFVEKEAEIEVDYASYCIVKRVFGRKFIVYKYEIEFGNPKWREVKEVQFKPRCISCGEDHGGATKLNRQGQCENQQKKINERRSNLFWETYLREGKLPWESN